MNDKRERLVGLPESVLRAPARVRRAIYQLHLWTGLVLGLYLAMLSVTGSALAEAARRAYPGYDVTAVGTQISRNRSCG